MDVRAFLTTAQAALESDMALRVYAVGGGALLLAASAWLAQRELKIVQALSPNDFTRNFSGKEPWSCKGLQNRIDALTAFRKAKFRVALRHIGALAVLGFAVPSLVLAAMLRNYTWLFAAQAPFVRASDPAHPLVHPSLAEIATFIFSQFARSTTDILEVFQIDIGPIAIARGQFAAQAAVLGYHFFVGGFAFAIAYAIFVLVRVGTATDNKIYRLSERLNAQRKFGACE